MHFISAGIVEEDTSSLGTQGMLEILSIIQCTLMQGSPWMMTIEKFPLDTK